MTKTDKEIRGWEEIIIETEDGELLIDITHDNYIAKDGYNIRLVPCEDEKTTIEEAIKIINCYDIGFYDLSGEKIPADKLAEAFHMAIEALKFAEHFDLLKEFQSLQEVVRCKDCKHRDLFSCPLTENDFQKDEDFCSWGERKGGDTE